MSRRLGLFLGALLVTLAGLSCVYVKEMNLIRLGDKDVTPTSRPATSQPWQPSSVDEVLEEFYR